MGAILLAFLLATGAGQAGGEGAPLELSVARIDAQRLLAEAGQCSLEGMVQIRRLLRRYGRRPEPELRLLSAQARLHAGSLNWFRERREEARNWFIGITRLYGKEMALPFQRVVASANYMLALTVQDRTERARYLDRVISRHAATDDFDLLQTYVQALEESSSLAREVGQEARSADLMRRANEIYEARIRPNMPPIDENAPICV
jgi:hypothetical protein